MLINSISWIYLDNYKEASAKEKQIIASASEPEHMVRVTPKSPMLQKKSRYCKTLQGDSDSCKFPKLIF